MPRPRFRTTPYQNYPEPFYADWQGEPVPGWGVRPVMAGPARLGVGQLVMEKADGGGRPYTFLPSETASQPIADAKKVAGLPWWAWPVAAAALFGVVGYVGTKKRWF